MAVAYTNNTDITYSNTKKYRHIYIRTCFNMRRKKKERREKERKKRKYKIHNRDYKKRGECKRTNRGKDKLLQNTQRNQSI